MLAIARYTLKGPFHAATMVGVLGMLSLVIPMISVLSGALVSLIILTQGLASGTRAILVAIVGITAVTFVMTQSWMLGVTIGLVQWLPVMLLAEILRRTRSLSFTMVVGMVISVLIVAIQFGVWPDAETQMTMFLQQYFVDASTQSSIDAEKLREGLTNIVHWMMILLVAVMYTTFLATLLAGRWFQAKLSESSGFRDEFYKLRLGQSAAIASLVISLAAGLLQSDWILAMAMVVLSTLLYQGMAVAHSWSHCYRKKHWLVMLYVAMILIPQVLPMVALLGIVDNWLDFRSRFKSDPQTD